MVERVAAPPKLAVVKESHGTITRALAHWNYYSFIFYESSIAIF